MTAKSFALAFNHSEQQVQVQAARLMVRLVQFLARLELQRRHALRRARWERDSAISRLVRARRQHRTVRPLQAEVFAAVAAVQAVR